MPGSDEMLVESADPASSILLDTSSSISRFLRKVHDRVKVSMRKLHYLKLTETLAKRFPTS